MKSLGDLMNDTPRPSRWERNRYRHGAIYVRDPAAHSTPLDRNAKARLLFLAEALDRRTKAPGRRNGALGYVGLAVLRALVLRFHNSRSGLCYPSILSLECATGLCRGAVCDGLARLERAGIVRIIRRIVRAAVTRVSPITGLTETYVGTVQSSSLYSFATSESAIRSDTIDLPAANARPFPARRQSSSLARLIGCEAGSPGEGETSYLSIQRELVSQNK